MANQLSPGRSSRSEGEARTKPSFRALRRTPHAAAGFQRLSENVSPGLSSRALAPIADAICNHLRNSLLRSKGRNNSLRSHVGNFLANNWIRRCFRDRFRGKAADSAKFPAFFRATREFATQSDRSIYCPPSPWPRLTDRL